MESFKVSRDLSKYLINNIYIYKYNNYPVFYKVSKKRLK